MTIIKDTYIDSIGTKYELHEFDRTKIYHPTQRQTVKQANAAYYAAKEADKKAAEQQAIQASKPKQLTPDEVYQEALERDKAKKKEQQRFNDSHKQALEAHQAYLKSSPEVAEICCTSFEQFCDELIHWNKQKYKIVPNTLNCIPPSLFVAHLTK